MSDCHGRALRQTLTNQPSAPGRKLRLSTIGATGQLALRMLHCQLTLALGRHRFCALERPFPEPSG